MRWVATGGFALLATVAVALGSELTTVEFLDVGRVMPS